MPEEFQPQQSLAVRPSNSWSLVPKTLGEAREMAEIIAGSDFAPKDYKGKPANVLIAIQMGLDVGLKPMQALQNVSVINGRPSIWGDAALALVMPELDRFIETFEGEKYLPDGKTFSPGYTAVCVSKRRGWPDETRRTFTVADAIRAGLWGKTGPWSNYPERMLQMRARGFNLRDVGADRLLGLVLTEEAQDYIEGAVVRTEEVTAGPVDLLAGLPEALLQSIGKGFEALSMSPAQQAVKLNEFLGGEGKQTEENAVALQLWLKDEYAKRKFGKPVDRGDNSRKKPTAEDKAVNAAKPVGSGSTVEKPAEPVADPTPEPKAEPKAEPKHEPVTAPTAAEIF